MKKLSRALAVFCGILALQGCGSDAQKQTASSIKEAPNAYNNPAILGVQTKPYQQIQARAQVTSKHTWNGSYWPNSRLGIAARWQQGLAKVNPFEVAVPNISMIQAMSPAERNRLSPAEKYDLLAGRWDFPVTRSEIALSQAYWRSYRGEIPEWFGICDGWAVASVLMPEPKRTVRAQTPFGFTIDLYPADMKAMLSYFFAKTRLHYRAVGGRCNAQTIELDANGRPIRAECRDLNPATLHLALDELIARQNRPIILDLQPGYEVWNYPISAYEMAYSNMRQLSQEPQYQHAAPGTVYLVDVKVQLQKTALVQPHYQPSQPLISSEELRYTLELDAWQRVIGGEWISKNHPDFLWDVYSFDQVVPNNPVVNYQLLYQLMQYAI